MGPMITVIVDELCRNCSAHLVACLSMVHDQVESAQTLGRAERHLPVIWDHPLYGRCVSLTCAECGALHLWSVGALESHCLVAGEEMREGQASSREGQPIGNLGLRSRVKGALLHQGYDTVGRVLEVLRREGDEGLLGRRNLGPKALAELKERLSACGFTVPTMESRGAIELLGLHPRINHVLRGAGLHHISDVVKKLACEGDEGFLRLGRLGPKSLAELKEKLADQGFFSSLDDRDSPLERDGGG